MIVINSAYYGDRKEFNTLEEAETELQDCYPNQGKIVLHLLYVGGVLKEEIIISRSSRACGKVGNTSEEAKSSEEAQ